MSSVAQRDDGMMVMDPYEIGWYTESADESIYRPVSQTAQQMTTSV